MMRLTVHVENAPFTEKERTLIGKDPQGKDIFKPKKSKCIVNTFSFTNLRDYKEVNEKLTYIKSKHKVDKWKEGLKKGQEMVYISNC